jgi:hypothetical protein
MFLPPFLSFGKVDVEVEDEVKVGVEIEIEVRGVGCVFVSKI